MVDRSRRIATIEFALSFRRRYATRILRWSPALKGRANLKPTLRVESTSSEVPRDCNERLNSQTIVHRARSRTRRTPSAQGGTAELPGRVFSVHRTSASRFDLLLQADGGFEAGASR